MTCPQSRDLDTLQRLNAQLRRKEITPAEATARARELYAASKAREVPLPAHSSPRDVAAHPNTAEVRLRAEIATSPAYYAEANHLVREGADVGLLF